MAAWPRRLNFRRRLVPGSRRGRIWLGIFVGLALIIGLVGRQLAAPSEGHIIPVQDHLTKVQTAPKPIITPATTLTNDYFNLALPPGYAVQTVTAPPSGLLFNQTVIKSGSFGSLIISISLQKLPDGGLSEDSSYRLRQQADRYVLSSQAVSGETVQIANDKQTAAVAAFWAHRAYLATISISSGLSNPSGDDNADEVAALQPLLTAWQWR